MGTSVSFAFGPVLVYLLALGGWGLPLGIPPGPEDPVLANAAPENCLIYLSWAGTVKPDPKSNNQTEQLLAEPEVRALVAELRRMLRSGIKGTDGEEAGADRLGDSLLDAAETALHRPGAVFFSAVQAEGGMPDVRGAVVLNLGEDLKRVQGLLEEVQQRLWKERAAPAQVGGQPWHRISLGEGLPAIFWGARQNYLIVAVGEEELHSLLNRVNGKPPVWLAKARRECAVPRPANIAYLDVKRIVDVAWRFIPDPQVKTALEALGARSVTHVTAMTGLDETGVVTRTVLGLEGQNLGIFALADGQPLSPDDLAAIPRDATIALAFRLQPERAWATLNGILKKIDPRAKEEFARGVRGLEAEVGFNLHDDLLKSLGDTWCVYTSFSEGSFWGFTAAVRVKDAARLAKAHGQLIARLRELFQSEEGSRGGAPRFSQFRFAGQDVYYLQMRGFGFPVIFPVSPSWCLTPNELILALSPQGIKAALSRPHGDQSLAAAPEVATLLRPGTAPIKLIYVDTPQVFRSLYSWTQTCSKSG